VNRLWLLVATLGPLAGCVLDFDQFRAPGGGRDVVPVTDAGFDGGFDAGFPKDVGTPLPDAPAMDAGTPDDRTNPQCVPSANASVRVAHMGVGHGAVDLCMRRNGGAPFAPVISNDWPDQGVGYGMVSQHVALNLPVTAPNDRWQFALVPHGANCTAAGGDAGVAVATHSVTIDPQSESTLLFTSEVTNDGRLLGLLGLLNDQRCTTCPSNTIDVRAVHAAFGASAERIDFSINYSLPPSYPEPFVNVFFATNVSYGQTAPVGGAGFDCDPDWRVAASLPLTYSVQFAALNVSSDILARSERVALKTELLLHSRMATLFFLGGDAARPAPPEFVLCYEGTRNAGMTVCDRIPGTAEARPTTSDAGASTLVRDAGAGADDASDDDVLL
jgi:hypothetical protein